MLQITKPQRPNDVRQRRGFAFCGVVFIGFIGFDDFAVADEEAGEKHDVDYHWGDIVHMGVALQTIVADPKC